MNNKALTMSILMAVLAVVFLQSYVSSIEKAQENQYGSKVVVIRAKQNIKEMDTINETMLDKYEIPRRFLEPTAVYFVPDENATDEQKMREATKKIKELEQSVALVNIRKNEQITLNKLTTPGLRTGLAAQVAPGRRAISIPVTEMTGVGKLIKPGDRVDVLAVIDAGGGKENKIAKTILQDVVILSVGRTVTNNVARTIESDTPGKERIRSLAEDFSFNSATLEVEPAQAQALALLMANGGENQLSLSLRNNDDTDRANLTGMVLMDVLGPDAARIRMPAGRR